MHHVTRVREDHDKLDTVCNLMTNESALTKSSNWRTIHIEMHEFKITFWFICDMVCWTVVNSTYRSSSQRSKGADEDIAQHQYCFTSFCYLKMFWCFVLLDGTFLVQQIENPNVTNWACEFSLHTLKITFLISCAIWTHFRWQHIQSSKWMLDINYSCQLIGGRFRLMSIRHTAEKVIWKILCCEHTHHQMKRYVTFNFWFLWVVCSI